MNIRSICCRDLVTLDEEASVTEAAQRLRDRHVGCLLVTSGKSESANLVGVLTDRDLVVNAMASGVSAPGPVGEFAHRHLVAVREEDDLMTAIDAMRDHGVRRLLVLDGTRNVVGITSLDDLLGACAHEVAALAQALQKGLRQEEVAALASPPERPVPRLAFPAMGTLGWQPSGGR